MKKIAGLLILFIMIFGLPSAANSLKSGINITISQSGINRGGISVSVKDVQSGKTVYALNPKMPVSPASIQKIVTSIPAFITLGEDYRFATKLYKNSSNEYLIVLGADPYLTSKELEKITKAIPKEPAGIFIDDSVIDKNEWGEGWQWDDDLNPLMPKFSAYNIDKNLIEIVISPTVKGFPAEITMEETYPTTFVNKIITGKETKYTLKRKNHVSPDIITAEGTIRLNKSEIRNIPINNPKKYFKLRLTDAILDEGISSSGIYPFKKLNKNYTIITLLSHDIQRAQEDILKNSNNLVTETVFKLAGGKYSAETGSFENGLEMFKDFCKKQKIDTSDIKLTDASGVSKNNLMSADFMTDFLIKNCDYTEKKLPTAGEGTLSNRLLYLKGMLYAKTGTLNNISSITGYVTSRANRKYAFCIMINDPKSKPSDKKLLEEYIIRVLYTKG
ncbi:MAG: D-alanyl-D-alanine carboxypeptidase/D-alanyl-D-alanine-endopeptidase [Candidatus Gastranaerophilales bacterium]|nr:D-alanyl-D-alanine carboxypeptidase/D-alanyl-D-alanine-endopeptidase [Candidatus Gastranaerophilales bacterium]